MIYQITEEQRQQLLEFARQATYLTAPYEVAHNALILLQSLAPVDAEPVALFKADSDGDYVELIPHHGQALEDGTPLYTHPLRELSDDEIDAAWRSVDYTQPYHDFRIAIARAVLKAAR